MIWWFQEWEPIVVGAGKEAYIYWFSYVVLPR
jgi:hypothetical protein